MPCLVGLIGFFFPRFAIVMLVLFSDYIGDACKTNIWPFLGFIFAPYTTLAYAFAINSKGEVSGLHLVLLIVAILFDLGIIGGGAKGGSQQVQARTPGASG